MADADLARLGSLVRQLQGMLGGKSIKTGSVDLVYTASAYSAIATVTHGFDVAPVFVVVANRYRTGIIISQGNYDNVGASTFTAQGLADAAFTGTVTHLWLAIG